MQKRKQFKQSNRTLLGTDTVVSEETGEVIDTRTRYREYAVKSRYVSMYLDDDNLFGALQGLGNFGAAWGYVLNNYNHETITFYFTTTIKEDMCVKLNLSVGTIRNAIKSFCDSGLLMRHRGSEYFVNPSLFYRGRWEDRERMVSIYEGRKKEKEIKVIGDNIDKKTVKP